MPSSNATPSGRREVAWLVGVLWFTGFVVMTGAELAFAYEGVGVGLTRALLMAAVGAVLSLTLWRWVISASWPIPTRIALLAAGVVAVVALQTALDFVLLGQIRAAFDEAVPKRRILSNDALRGAVMLLIAESGVLLYASFHAFFGMAAMAVRSAAEARQRDRLLADARAAATEAQLAALRHQLSPHFVFNALNALGALVETGRTRDAGLMVDRLSNFLRSSLGGEGGAFVTLDDELEMLQAYLEIEAVRFGDRLQVRYDCPPAVGSALVPGFVLQPLVENAIKHGVAPAMRPVAISLSACAEGDDLLLSVEDNGPGAAADLAVKPRGAGVGLRNVRERLSILYGPRGVLEAGRQGTGFTASVRLPLAFAQAGAAS